MSAASPAESTLARASIESIASSEAGPASKATLHAGGVVSPGRNSRRAVGHVWHESLRLLAAVAAIRADPTFFPLPNRSTRKERMSAGSNCAESRAEAVVNRGAMTKASCGVGPAMNSAGPADESHGDASGLATTVLSGGGATGVAVSFRAVAGVLAGSHAMAKTTSSSRVVPRVFRGCHCI